MLAFDLIHSGVVEVFRARSEYPLRPSCNNNYEFSKITFLEFPFILLNILKFL